MDLPAVVGFLSVLVWGFILGPIGALLAVPMTMMVRTIFLESSTDTEQLGLLLRSGPPLARTHKPRFWWLRRTRGTEPPPGSTSPSETPAAEGGSSTPASKSSSDASPKKQETSKTSSPSAPKSEGTTEATSRRKSARTETGPEKE
jgi:hypothetical protein